MVKGIIAFFVFISVTLLLLVYFAGDYSLDPSYFTTKLTGGEIAERSLIFDRGSKKNNSYSLKVSTRGVVEFIKDDQGDKDFRNFEVEAKDIDRIRQEMDKTGVFKIVSLDRNYCLDRYESRIDFDFSWIHKGVDYSNCSDDPTELKNFRKFLYQFLGLELAGTK